jgi:hypothetical protein
LPRIVQKPATRGSQRWLQQLVRDRPALLDDAFGLGDLRWFSPQAHDAFAEYQGEAFLKLLGVELDARALSTFWPRGGPVWDGLAKSESGTCLLVEAKAHTAELSSSCRASSARSLSLIQSSLAEAKAALGIDPAYDWCSEFYQYANRVAHAYLLSVLNGVPVALVFLYFVGASDIGGPATREGWHEAIDAAHVHLGLRGALPAYVQEVFVDVSFAD